MHDRTDAIAIHCNPAPRRASFPRAAMLALAASGIFAVVSPGGEVPEAPRSTDPSVKVSLFAAEPQIVTPIGAAFDAAGRLLVVESNTHFRPKNYSGPAMDRIRLFPGVTQDAARPDEIGTIYQGGPYLMNLVGERDGALVSSRNEIFRLAAHPGGNPAEKTTLAHLETTATYPHNGLHGLAEAKDGHVYFGIGENLGGAYTLVGSDGKKLSDDKGSGAIFRVDGQGRDLTLIARGFWNPFGLGFDAMGNLWAVDNDPDGRPPCRLINVVPGGDYGFEFRYGRTGMHPLQAWDAELPGTLGMVAGVGEAPCAVVWNRGRLFVSSWRDHQVQCFTLTPRGASFSAASEPLLTGGENFRPVGLAFAPDGALFVNDWGSASYSVNGKGRIWKVTFAQPAPADPNLTPTDAMRRAGHLRESDNLPELVAALDDADPATAQAAQYGLSRLAAAEKIEWKSLQTARQRIGLLAALMWRGSDLQPQAAMALKDESDQVRQMGVRVIAAQNIKALRDALNESLNSQVMSPRLLGMTIATMNQLDGDKNARIDASKIKGVLLARMNSSQATDLTRATALHMLENGHPAIPLEQLAAMAQSPNSVLQLEAIKYLAGDQDRGRFALLAKIAADEKANVTARAEALAGLSDDAPAQVDLLLQGAGSSETAIREESLRSLKPAVGALTPSQKQQLEQVAKKFPAQADLVRRIMGVPLAGRPAETDVAGWQRLLAQAPGDPEAGRRIFFHPAGPGCFHCHTLEGRGKSIGPDLTMIGHSQTREHVLESILDPSREIAPLFTLWSIKTRTGQQIDGMLLRRDGQEREVYVDSSGQETTVPEPQIIDRRMRKESLMPQGLVQGLTDQELRDLVAALVQRR